MSVITPTVAQRHSAAWVAALFLITVLLQRFAVPGFPTIALLIPAVACWTAAALARGVLVVEPTRFVGWLAAAATTATLMLVQEHLVDGAEINPGAWVLMVVIWLPFVFRLRECDSLAYVTALHYIATIATALAAASIAMIAIQLLGVPYHDWFAELVPPQLQIADFNTSYPIEFRSPIYKSNAFIGLEPSMVSAMLGVGLLAAALTRAQMWKIVTLVAGLVATVAGSGMIIALVGIAIMLFARASRQLVARYIPLLVVVLLVGSLTTFGRLAIQRVDEFQSSNSSTSLRLFEPIRALYPNWSTELTGVLFGYGPGSSQRVVNATSIEGALVTTPLKIFFEYGIAGGLVLAGFVLICYWGGPSRALAVSLLVSTWLLQAGLGSVIIVLPVLLTVTLWSPRLGAPIESSGFDLDDQPQSQLTEGGVKA